MPPVVKGRIELPTRSFSDCRSTTELLDRIGAGTGSRTPAASVAHSPTAVIFYPHGGEGRTRTSEGAMPPVLQTGPFAARVTSPFIWLREPDLNRASAVYETAKGPEYRSSTAL